jgi:hypothetical protein
VLAGMPDSFALYFQGSLAFAGGAGSPFGDGLRCAGGGIIRIATVLNSNGMSAYPVPGQASLSAAGLVFYQGNVGYQVWYRNSASFCASSLFNLTNAVQVGWGP